jgi:hypothetical protein
VTQSLAKRLRAESTAIQGSWPNALRCLSWLLVLTFFASRNALGQQTAASLVIQALKNEDAARPLSDHEFFVSEQTSKRTGGHLWQERSVQLGEEVLHRLVAVDGIPLTPERARAEDQRIDKLVSDPEAFHNANQKHDHREDLSSLVPRAFVFTFDGQSRGCTRVRFSPQPSFKPSGYEQTILHTIEGTIAISEPDTRICEVNGHLANKVEIVHGIAGKIERGGRVHILRSRMPDGTWQLTSLSIHLEGNILFLKDISQNNDETRTAIRGLPADMTLAQAALLTKP